MEIEFFTIIYDGLLSAFGNSIILFALLAVAGVTFTLSILRVDPIFAILAAAFPFVMYALYASVDIFVMQFVVIALLSLVASISIYKLIMR